ncbi:thioredoxin domain-containing protein [Desulfococcaceae bacterium HSG8]|nr:thioredoxin domain-containing protein [Desulfococcaceae bacterium HSG8]
MKKQVCLIVIFICIFLIGIQTLYAMASADTVPVKGMITMIDLGAKKCIPCKMMAPILEELKKEYEGRAAIVFIDVWQKENAAYARKFGIRGIPTQIFFDKVGKEVFRHVGFMDKKSIVSMLEKLGVK